MGSGVCTPQCRSVHCLGALRCRPALGPVVRGVQRIHRVGRARAAVTDGGESGPDDLSSSFARELAKREQRQSAASEAEEAQDFDGGALLQLLQDRHGSLQPAAACKRMLSPRW